MRLAFVLPVAVLSFVACGGDGSVSLPDSPDAEVHNQDAGEPPDSGAEGADAALPDGPDASGPSCGDHTCDPGESCTSCAGDCGACPATCGDDACDPGESCTSCEADCGACPATCGDHTCDPGESCTSCAGDCGACPIPCDKEGGTYCGGDGVGGDPSTLYRCVSGALTVIQQCGGTCVWMPPGIPDRCPITSAPQSVIDRIDDTPYVEQSCTSVDLSSTWGWTHPAKRCTYSSGGLTATVDVANPSADRVARWIVDAAYFIPRLRALQQSSPTQWEEGLKAIGLHMLYQSSRIFPINGGIIENMGGGYTTYNFERGTTRCSTCTSYCRINSLTRREYCGWREWRGQEGYDACIARLGSAGWTDAWAGQCLANHDAAWDADFNEHFRAKAHAANAAVEASCSAGCDASQVVAAVKSAYGL